MHAANVWKSTSALLLLCQLVSVALDLQPTMSPLNISTVLDKPELVNHPLQSHIPFQGWCGRKDPLSLKKPMSAEPIHPDAPLYAVTGPVTPSRNESEDREGWQREEGLGWAPSSWNTNAGEDA